MATDQFSLAEIGKAESTVQKACEFRFKDDILEPEESITIIDKDVILTRASRLLLHHGI